MSLCKCVFQCAYKQRKRPKHGVWVGDLNWLLCVVNQQMYQGSWRSSLTQGSRFTRLCNWSPSPPPLHRQADIKVKVKPCFRCKEWNSTLYCLDLYACSFCGYILSCVCCKWHILRLQLPIWSSGQSACLSFHPSHICLEPNISTAAHEFVYLCIFTGWILCFGATPH